MRSTKRAIIACLVAGLAAVAVLLGVSTTANAEDQANTDKLNLTVACGGEWHWVHNQLPASYPSPVLTAQFASGTYIVKGTVVPGGATVHYRLTLPSGDTLLSASDNITGGKLVLSSWPQCGSPSPTPTPSGSGSGS